MNDWNKQCGSIIEAIRTNRPKVHCITNEVAVTYSANALLAMGAVPSMTWQPAEVSDFVTSADALVVNLGTLDPGRFEGMQRAIDTAKTKGLPIVLDPVFVERSSTRLSSAVDLIKTGPDIIRGNAEELDVLHAHCADITRFSDAIHVRSGEVDEIIKDSKVVQVHNGHPLMAQVTATGCAATALLGACAAVSESAFVASVAAMAILGVAGEQAAKNSAGPGSLQFALLDALASINQQTLNEKCRVT